MCTRIFEMNGNEIKLKALVIFVHILTAFYFLNSKTLQFCTIRSWIGSFILSIRFVTISLKPITLLFSIITYYSVIHTKYIRILQMIFSTHTKINIIMYSSKWIPLSNVLTFINSILNISGDILCISVSILYPQISGITN